MKLELKSKTFGRMEDADERCDCHVGFVARRSTMVQVDEAALELQISRSAFIRNAVERELEAHNHQAQ